LNWLAPSSPDRATSYVIEAGSSSGATNLAAFDTGSSATTLTVTDVPAGTYYVRVRASNSAGPSAPSNEVVLTVGGGPAPCTTLPEAPTGLGATVSGTSLTLRWSAPAAGCPPLGYRIEAGSTPGASDLGSFSSNGASTSFAASNVPAGIYYVRVRGGNVSSLGVPSNEVVVSVAVEREPAGSVAGRWVGLVANGDGVTGNPDPMCGIERFDWQLDLTQAGSTVTGTLTQTTVVSTCEPPGTAKVAALTGTAGPGTFSFSIGPSRNVTATYTASRMTGSADFGGTFVLSRR
jgi:predicted phage tail protein